jgi:hypothetical protein
MYHYDGEVILQNLENESGAEFGHSANHTSINFVLDWTPQDVTNWLFKHVLQDIPVARRQQSLLNGKQLLAHSQQSLEGAPGAMLLPGTPLYFASKQNRDLLLSHLGDLRGAAIRQCHAHRKHQAPVLVQSWKVEHVAWWMSVKAGLGYFVDAIWVRQVHGQRLLALTDSSLESMLGVTKRKHRRKLLKLIAELSEQRLPSHTSDPQGAPPPPTGGKLDLTAISVTEIVRMGPTAVATWVEQGLNLPQYRRNFEEEGVNGKALLGLTDRQLRLDLHISSKTHREKIMEHVVRMRHMQMPDGPSKPAPEESDTAPLMLLLQERHQQNLKAGSVAARRSSRRRELDYQMWVTGVDSFAGTGPQAGSRMKLKKWPEEVVGALRRICRAVGGSGLTLPEAFESFKSKGNTTDTIKRGDFEELVQQMGIHATDHEMTMILATIRGKSGHEKKGVPFWEFVAFFTHNLGGTGFQS